MELRLSPRADHKLKPQLEVQVSSRQVMVQQKPKVCQAKANLLRACAFELANDIRAVRDKPDKPITNLIKVVAVAIPYTFGDLTSLWTTKPLSAST